MTDAELQRRWRHDLLIARIRKARRLWALRIAMVRGF